MIFWFGVSAIALVFSIVITLIQNGPPLTFPDAHPLSGIPTVQESTATGPAAPQTTTTGANTTSMATTWPNDLTQHSTVSALMAGHASSGPPASQLSHYGTHGIGTFARMDGELLLLDRQAWQFTRDGAARRAPPSAAVPFVQVTSFSPEHDATVPRAWRKRELLALTRALGGPDAGGPNSFMAILLKGRFRSVALRAAGPQARAGQPLAEVAREARQWSSDAVGGTMFGFVSPEWAQGLSVAGAHLHFLSDDEGGRGAERQGGHVRDFEAEPGARLQWAVCGHVHLGLPRGQAWEALDMALDSKGIEAAEE